LGGVGKSTFPKDLFDLKSSNYTLSCFLFDVKGKSPLLHLSSKLLKSLTGSDLLRGLIDEGIEKLKRYLSSSDALIVLDDVNQMD